MAARIEIKELGDPAHQKEITDAIEALDGVLETKIEKGALHVSYDPLTTTEKKIEQAIRSARAQSPTFAERGAVANLGRHAEALLIHLHPERIRFVEIERIIFGIARSEDGPRFARSEHITTHVALRSQMPRSQYFLDHLTPIPYRLAIHFYNDMPDNRRSDSFVGEGKVNVGGIAAVELEDGPYCRAHLLALHVGGVTGNTQSQESNKGRNDCVVSAGAARFLYLGHGAEHIAGGMTVNQGISAWTTPCAK